MMWRIALSSALLYFITIFFIYSPVFQESKATIYHISNEPFLKICMGRGKICSIKIEYSGTYREFLLSFKKRECIDLHLKNMPPGTHKVNLSYICSDREPDWLSKEVGKFSCGRGDLGLKCLAERTGRAYYCTEMLNDKNMNECLSVVLKDPLQKMLSGGGEK